MGLSLLRVLESLPISKALLEAGKVLFSPTEAASSGLNKPSSLSLLPKERAKEMWPRAEQ